MKILQLFWWITSILLVNVLTGCEKRDAVLPVLTSSQSEIEAAIDELAGFFRMIGMPSTLGEFGLTLEDVDRLADCVIASKGEPFGAFRKLTRDDVVAIYKSAF